MLQRMIQVGWAAWLIRRGFRRGICFREWFNGVLSVPVDFDQFCVEGLSEAELDALPLYAVRVDAQGVVLQVNQPAQRVFDRSRDDILGQNFFDGLVGGQGFAAFRSVFLDGVACDRLKARFSFEFDFPAGPMRTTVDLRPAGPNGQYWILVDPERPPLAPVGAVPLGGIDSPVSTDGSAPDTFVPRMI